MLRNQVPILSPSVTPMRITWSARRKNTAASAAKMNTIAVVIPVSLREGQVTLLVSCRTSWANLNGLNLAIRFWSLLPATAGEFQIGSCRPSLKDEQTDPVWGIRSPRKSVTGPLGDGEGTNPGGERRQAAVEFG